MSEPIVTEATLVAFEEYLLREEKSAATVEKYLRDTRLFITYVQGRLLSKDVTVAY